MHASCTDKRIKEKHGGKTLILVNCQWADSGLAKRPINKITNWLHDLVLLLHLQVGGFNREFTFKVFIAFTYSKSQTMWPMWLDGSNSDAMMQTWLDWLVSCCNRNSTSRSWCTRIDPSFGCRPPRVHRVHPALYPFFWYSGCTSWCGFQPFAGWPHVCKCREFHLLWTMGLTGLHQPAMRSSENQVEFCNPLGHFGSSGQTSSWLVAKAWHHGHGH